MAAVASTSVVNDHDTEKESRTDHSPSRFTAVNGKEPLISGPVAPAATPSPANGSVSSEDHRESPEILVRNGVDLQQSRRDENAQGNGNTGNGNTADEQDDRDSQRSSSFSGTSIFNKNKRKRSESGEQEETHDMPRKAPKSPILRLDDTIESQTRVPTSSDAITPHDESDIKHSPTVRPRSEDNVGDIRTPSANTNWHEYDSQLVHQAQRAQQFDASDVQLAEALQREANAHDTSQKNWSTSSRPAESPAQNELPASLNILSQERPQATMQIAPKRKRVFSNRTKTGCMTCRRRKKKCDEQHPACNNCIRGGFLCEGYSSRSTWQKPSSSKTPVPLQSKEGYLDVNAQYVHDINQQQDRQQPLTEQLDPGKVRPIIVDESDRTTAQYNTSPTGTGSSRGPWTKRTWGGTSHSTYISDHVAKSDYREVPSIHELSRDGHAKSDFPIVPSIRELSHGSHSKPGVPIYQGGIDQRPAHAGNIDTNSPQAQARMALSIEHQLSTRTVSTEDTEKDKMIRGDLYRPYDVYLVEERDRCKTALWRFNNACNPISGLSTKEQTRLLKEVLVPQGPGIDSPSGVASARAAGSIGQGAIVEAPFYCHYGYNVHIGEDALVSENCLFIDDCPITIGAHTWIGPRVTILSSMAHANMQERKGSQSRYQGRAVTIEEDCYVGAGCTIYPGVRLRRGAYVAPGEIVKSDIVAYGFQGLKPGYM